MYKYIKNKNNNNNKYAMKEKKSYYCYLVIYFKLDILIF